MTRDLTMPLYRRLAPLAIFAIVIVLLVASAVISMTDLIALRGSLSADTELLAKLKQRAARSDGKAALDPHDYVVEVPSQGIATADLQRRVSEILRSAGADLQLSEIIPSTSEGEVGRLAIAVNFEIGESRIVDLLHAVENAKPALLIERLSLRTLASGQGANQHRLQGTATIAAAWRAAP